MSRTGKLSASIPAGATMSLDDKTNAVTVKGPKGELTQEINPSIKPSINDGQITFEVDEKSPVDYEQKQAYHGLYRSLVSSMVVDVGGGYSKTLELIDVGFRVPS